MTRFFPVLIVWALAPVFAAHAAPIPAKVKFATGIDSPTSVRLCAGHLWASSAKNKSVTSLNPETGAALGITALSSIGAEGHILSMGCAGNSLLIAIQKRQGLSDRTFAFVQAPIVKNSGKLSKSRPLALPGSGLIRDVFCRGNTYYCFLIRDKVYKTSDLQKWQTTDIPASKEIAATDTNLKENPFANWQDQFIISDGQYFRGGFLDNNLFLLDPLRVSVTTFDLRGEESSKKWGHWGVWEGRLMSPKGITPVGKDIFAISDVALKLVFLYSHEGQYLGSVGADGGSARFGYPLDLVGSGNTLYVADFGKSKVTALDFNPASLASALNQPKPTKDIPKEAKIEELLRQNMFRDPDVLKARARTRCLTCHDGLQINSLDKFMEQGKHHPINITMKATKIDLPLEHGLMVTCSTCHDAHHGVSQDSATNKGIKSLPFMLRKPVKALCSTCHAGRSNPETNHPVMNPVDACADCHTMHVSQDFLLKGSVPNVCYECHGEDKKPGAHPFAPDMVNCTSCHSLHDSSPKLSFAAKTTCLTCHEDKKQFVGKNYHLGTEAQNTHKWNKDEGMCLDCHKPHAKSKPPVRQICTPCHGEIKGQHPVSIATADTAQGQGIVLENGKVGCMTCHDPHGGTPPNENGRSFFRPTPKLFEFCAGCHGEKASDVYHHFHDGRKK